MRLILALTLAAVALAALPAFAQPPGAPALDLSPDRRPRMSGPGDLDFVLEQLCGPYLAGRDVAALVDRPLVVKAAISPAWSGGAQAYMVGQASVMVAMMERGGDRVCTISLERGDPAGYRASLQRWIDAWPLTVEGFRYPPNDYASRELFCTAGAPHDSLLVSTNAPRRRPAMMITVQRGAERSPRCDQGPAAAQTPGAE